MRALRPRATFLIACLALAMRSTTSTFLETPSTMNTYPDYGMVEICMSHDCNVQNPSVVLSLDRLGKDVSVDPSTKEATFGTVIADFDQTYLHDKNADGVFTPFLTPPAVDDAMNPTAIKTTMKLLTCATGCTPRTASPEEVAATASKTLDDSIAIQVEMLHRLTDTSVNPSGFESYTFPRFGLQMNLDIHISPPSNDPQFALPYFALTLLLAVTDSGGPLQGVSLIQPQGTMYLQRLQLGSDMYMDLPAYSTIDGASYPVTVSALPLATGEKANLIQVTLEFGSMALASVKYTSIVSPVPSAFEHTPSPISPRALVTTGGGTPYRNIMFLHRGVTQFCMEARCLLSGFSLGFHALGSAQGLEIKRFGNAPAFQFDQASQDSLSAYGNAEVYFSSFSSRMQQYSQSLPTTAPVGSNDVRFIVESSLFLTAGKINTAGQSIAIPANSVKLMIMLESWTFASTTDRLMLNLSVESFTNAMYYPVNLSTNFSSGVRTTTIGYGVGQYASQVTLDEGKTLIFPHFAEIDGSAQKVEVAVVPDKATGIIIALQFPYFANSLSYIPIMGGSDIAGAGVTKILKKQVDSWVVSGILLGLLAFIIFVVVLHCVKKTRPVKLDFSKVIP